MTLHFLLDLDLVRLRTPRWVGYVMQRPEHHSTHHEFNVHNYNYGDIKWWDRFFGTFKDFARALRKFTDVRALQHQLKECGLTFISEVDENSTDPGSFMLADPDGNVILVDKHV